MPSIEELHKAALVLLIAHWEVNKKPPENRSDLETHLGQMGRNRLQSIMSISEQMIAQGSTEKG